MNPRFLRNRPILVLATGHWLSQVGLALVFTAVVTWLFLLGAELRAGGEHPYIGVALFGIVPAVLVLGLVLTPLGWWLGRRRIAERMRAGIDDRRLAFKRLAWFLGVTSIVNVAIGTQVTYRGIHHMESRQFCASCHVMAPEATAFSPGPHAGLMCVDCHVGSGAKGWFDSKVQGTRQLWDVLTDSVARPIASGIASGHMVSSDQTCERCHWKEMPGRVHLEIAQRFGEDEENTPEATVLTMHVGGTRMGGIHGAHLAPGVRIRFAATDPERQDVPWVEYTDANGETRTYVRKGADAADYAELEPVTMQCIDCHNRAAHPFQSPNEALDEALALGHVSTTLPYLKRESLKLLEAEYATREEAAARIPADLRAYYEAEYPEVWSTRRADVEEAAAAVASIHGRNVFPELGVDWGTYPNNIGHQDYPGCYRCHAGDHATAEGRTLTNKCVRCHTIAALEETDPQVLDDLGLRAPLERMRR